MIWNILKRLSLQDSSVLGSDLGCGCQIAHDGPLASDREPSPVQAKAGPLAIVRSRLLPQWSRVLSDNLMLAVKLRAFVIRFLRSA